LSLTLAFDGFRHVTIWQVPGADFLCIEPLRGHPEPVGFDGDYAAKPGAMLIEPGGRRSLRLTISVGDRAIAEQQS
jgi:galactose mutarotase-like enzyme